MATDSKFDGLFVMSNYSSEERYDMAKFMEYKGDTYDVLNSPFLIGLKKLPVFSYYRCAEGYKDIDLISFDAYGTYFYSYLIQYYNDTIAETFDEETVLYLFDIEALEDMYAQLSDNNLTMLT